MGLNKRVPNVDPEVLQSGFGVNFYFGLANLRGKSPANFSANVGGKFFPQMFGLVSSGFRPPQKFPPKIHAQNSRSNLSAFLSNLTFFNP